MSRHDEIMDLAKFAADIRASDTAEFYAGRLVSERNYKEALRKLSEAVAEQARRAACFDELVAALEECANRLEIHMEHTEDLIAHMAACKALANAKGML